MHTHTYITLHYITFHYITFRCLTLHYVPLRSLPFRSGPFRSVTYIHTYITLHTYIHTHIHTYICKYLLISLSWDCHPADPKFPLTLRHMRSTLLDSCIPTSSSASVPNIHRHPLPAILSKKSHLLQSIDGTIRGYFSNLKWGHFGMLPLNDIYNDVAMSNLKWFHLYRITWYFSNLNSYGFVWIFIHRNPAVSNLIFPE
jgi:hypothetical protein